MVLVRCSEKMSLWVENGKELTMISTNTNTCRELSKLSFAFGEFVDLKYFE